MKKQNVIICVDDEIMVLDVMRLWLQEAFGGEYAIEIAESGEEALEVLNDCLENGNRISLVITDYNMPGIKGDELISRLATLVPDASSIMLTGQVTADAVEASEKSPNFYCTMAKPWKNEELISNIEGALASFRARTTV